MKTTYKIIRIPGNVLEVECDEGSNVSKILEVAGIKIDKGKQCVSVDGCIIEPSQFNDTTPRDKRILVTRGAKGAAPTPLFKKARKYLLGHGFVETSGKGDHVKFTAPSGELLVLNTDKRDSKHLDIASAKQVARYFDINIAELYELLTHRK